MKLRTKFFSTILIVNIAVAIGLYHFLQLSFEESFTRYVSQRERSLAETLAVNLEAFYSENQSWHAFREQPQYWFAFTREYGRPRRREVLVDDLPGRLPQTFRLRRVPSGPLPLFLLDKDRNFLAGVRWPENESYMRPLKVGDELVGYLGVPIRPEMRDYLDREFAADQSRNLVVVLAATFLVALAIALPLSYLLVNRIAYLVSFVQRLSRGDYSKQLTLQGNDELNVLAQHLSNLGGTLSSVEQQRKQWVADVSHELRTPLAILRADIESMEDGIRPLDKQALPRLQQQVMRLKRLVDDLHDLSLTDLGSLTYRKKTCDLTAIVSKSVDNMTPQFEQRELQLTYQANNQGHLPVFGDEQRLTQVVQNLLQNSLNYTDAPGEVRVRLSKSDETATIEVSDSAPGVEEHIRPKLTERLFRVETSRSRNLGGAGLGLSLCANIVSAHGGTISFASSDLGGLQVIVSLPLQRSIMN